MDEVKPTVKIRSVSKVSRVGYDAGVLDATFDIYEGEEVVMTRTEEFPLDTPEADIEASAKKMLSTFISDKELSEKSAGVEAANQNADEVIKNLSGKEITNE